MKSFLTKNLGLKIASLIFATFMWIIVTNINDPVDYKTFDNVRVQIINTNMLDESGRVYEVLDGTDIIPRVTVRAPRTVIYRINHANIIAKADINEISSFDSIAITLEVDNVSENEINDIYGTIDRLKLNIENKKSQSFYIQAAAEGDVAEGYIYMPEDITIEPNTVTVSGPESIINQIASVKASFNVSNFANDISSTVEVKLYDTEGAVIPTDRLSQSIRNSSIKIPILE
ncbi:MAG: CdaR family protein, partial [Lachnospiraceae bacterium]|nr:CdaR family protein [Lachnospiraceae bacterium]